MSETTTAKALSTHRRWIAYDYVVSVLAAVGMVGMLASLL